MHACLQVHTSLHSHNMHALNALNCFRFLPLLRSFCKPGNKCLYTLMKQRYHLRQESQGTHSLHTHLPSRHTHKYTSRDTHSYTYAQIEMQFILSTHKAHMHCFKVTLFTYYWAVRTQAVVEPSTNQPSYAALYVHSYTCILYTHKTKTNKQTNKHTSLNLLEVKAGVSNRRLFLQDSPLANISVW